MFKENVKKVKLISNSMGMLEPEIGEEFEQRLTINQKGRVWFSGYGRDDDWNMIKLRQFHTRIPEESFERFLDGLNEYLEKSEMGYITDIGNWTLIITDNDGKNHKHEYSFYPQKGILHDISELIRKEMGMKDLFVFDGGQ